MASDGSSDLQNTVTKTQHAALGFRVKSGWAAVVLLTDTARCPRLSDVGRIDLCDPQLPETRQPYHAAMGKLETDSTKVKQRVRVVRSISQQSLTKLIKDHWQKGFRIKGAALVVGTRSNRLTSQIRTFARMPLKGSYFGRRWIRLCRTMTFALIFSSKATLTP